MSSDVNWAWNLEHGGCTAPNRDEQLHMLKAMVRQIDESLTAPAAGGGK